MMKYYAKTLISNAVLTLEYAENDSCLSDQDLIDQITQINIENMNLGNIVWADYNDFLSELDQLIISRDQFLPGDAF